MMPFYNNNDLMRYYSNYINEKANEKIDKIKNEIETEKKQSLERIDEEVRKKVYRNLEIELSELNSEFKINLNRVKTGYSKVLMEKRTELLNKILHEVQLKLETFSESKAYESLMMKEVKKLENEFCKSEVVFRIKINDALMKKVIEKQYKGTYTIKEIPEIEIGGFSVLCYEMGIMIDQTIDTRLKEKRQWLFEHSKLAASQ